MTASQLWRQGRQRCPELPRSCAPSMQFGAGAEQQTALATLVVRGIKRATAPSPWEFEVLGEPQPQVGDYNVVLDGADHAVAIIATTAIVPTTFANFSAQQAALEGEGDGSLAWWRQAHRDYFQTVFAGTCYRFSPTMPILFQQFVVVYPA